MPKLTNAKREHICQEYVKDLNATAAADRASYKNPNTLGPRLKAVPEVAARIAELQAEAAERNEVTVDSIADQLDEDRQLAYKLGQASAAVQRASKKGSCSTHSTKGRTPTKVPMSIPRSGNSSAEIHSRNSVSGFC